MRIRAIAIHAFLVGLIACSRSPKSEGSADDFVQGTSGDLLIENVHILDPETKTETLGSVLVEGTKIKEIITSGSANASKRIDGQGKWLTPGLVDMHTHVWSGNVSPHGFGDADSQDKATPEMNGNRYLFAGVTTYLDLFSPSDAGDNPAATIDPSVNTFALRAKQRDGLLHPHDYVAGPLFLVPGSHGVLNWAAGDAIAITVKDAAGDPLTGSALEAVAATTSARVTQFIESHHPDVIKLVYDNMEDLPTARPETMPPRIAKAIIDAARAKDVKTVAHVGTWKGVEELAKLGLTAFTHFPNGAAPASTIAAIKEHDVTAISTIVVYSDYGDMIHESKRTEIIGNGLASFVMPDGLRDAYLDFASYDPTEKGWVEFGAAHNERGSQRAALNSLFEAGVRVLVGTDSGNTGALFGYSVSRELIRYEEAGLPKWEILRAATSEPQKFLGRKSGAIQAGYDADLVLFDASPLDSMANTQKVSQVIFRGQVVDRSTLDLVAH